MALRDYFAELLRSRLRGRVEVDRTGEERYLPPGHRVKALGDVLALLGSLGYVYPVIGIRRGVRTYVEGGIPAMPVYPGIDPELDLVLLVYIPLATVPIVVLTVYFDRIGAKLAMFGIGLAGTVATYPLTNVVFWAKSTGAGPLIGLVLGSWLVLLGGCLGLVALSFGEWAKQFDETPKR